MQCPLMNISSCCGCGMPKLALVAVAALGAGVGLLSLFSPQRSIGLYQWIMERFNWRVAPIDAARELRNTRILGIILTALSLAIFIVSVCPLCR